MKLTRTVDQIEQEIADLKRRWPAHSPKPEMLIRLEQLEDELAEVGTDA